MSPVDRVISACLRRPWPVVAAAAAVAVAGALSYGRLPFDALPDLAEKQLLVFADWPGHSPAEVDEQVTRIVSANLGGIAGVEESRSSSEFGFSMITLALAERSDPQQVRALVAGRLPLVQGLPAGVLPYVAPDASALGQVFWYTVEGGGLDPGALRTLHDRQVRPQLAAVPGVSEVATVGGYRRELQVEIAPDRLRSFGVSLGQVASALASNGSVGGSTIAHGQADYVVRATSWARSAADLEATVVAQGARAPVLLGQVGTVRLGPAPRRAFLEKDGTEAVGGVVVAQRGENPLAVIDRVKERIAALAPGLPEGVRIVPFHDRSRLVHAALATVEHTLLEELAACVIMVLLLLGHLRSSVVVAASLAVAVLLALALMWAFDVPANLMSLAGIAIAVGVLTDSAMVMTENAHARLAQESWTTDAERTAIARRACLQVGRPLLFSVLITLVSFLPVFALRGVEGRMFRPLALTKTFALGGVALLCITLVPALIPLFVRGRIEGERQSALVRATADVYRPALRFLLDRPWWVACPFALLAAVAVLLHPRLGSEFMPHLDEGTIVDMPVSSPGISLGQVEHDLLRRDAVLRSLPEVESVVGKAGRAETATDPAPLEMIETMVELLPRDQWPARALPEATFRSAARAALGPQAAAGAVDAVAVSAERAFDAAMRERLAGDRAAPLEELADAALENAVARAAAGSGSSPLRGSGFDRPSLARKSTADLVRELDGMLRVPGWTNIWTQPIVNRVDMLSTGFRTQAGVKVFGDDLAAIHRVSAGLAALLRDIPGAADVSADQIVGQPYVTAHLDRPAAALRGAGAAQFEEALDFALAGREVATTLRDGSLLPIRLRTAPAFADSLEKLAQVPVGIRPLVLLGDVAELRATSGPSMIRGERGQPVSYVQLNVRGRDLGGFVEEARARVAAELPLPAGVHLEWGGEYQQQLRARGTLALVLPAVFAAILLLLYWLWRDAGDALLVFLTVPGALVGGLVFQWLWGFHFSVPVWIGYVTCFGFATETGVIMLVYLRDAIDRRGGLAAIGGVEELRAAVLDGAVQRLRPKLLTEGVIILGLVPMLWATGAGSELIRPIAAPVLGGILVADEIIDLSIPALFFWLRRARWLAARGPATTPEIRECTLQPAQSGPR
ncbi:MAG TPA: efflux RND transporter permease subunit [Myxococcales bacterium]